MTLFDEHTVERAVEHHHLVRVRMVIAYDGGPFHGFAANAGVATVAGTLEHTIERVIGHRVTITGAGRTDRGVHAWGQVISFDAPSESLDLVALQRSINQLCGGPIVVREASVADADFDARFSARARVYRYTIVNRPVPDPFLGGTSWWIEQPLDLRAMRLACDPLIGEHDFASFCRRPKPRSSGGYEAGEASLVRRVLDARWDPLDDDVLRFTIGATAFCHQMVRSVVGTLVEVGQGKKRAGEMAGILRATDRSQAGQLAPAHGLCLWEVIY
jgi:tRNA pseudouridine38-40 synthase